MMAATAQQPPDPVAVLRAFADRNLAAWYGLPADCPASAARRAFALGEECDGRGPLGSQRLAAEYHALDDRPLRIWRRAASVVLLDFQGPFDDIDLVRLFGAPSHKTAIRWGYAALPDGEWLYPQRGLAAIVVAGGKVAHLLGFAPTTAERYAEVLRPDMGKQPLSQQPANGRCP